MRRVFQVSVGVLFAISGVALSAAQAPLTLPYTITSIAGGGTVCFTAADSLGNGCPATQATIGATLLGVAVDARGNVYVADTANNMIRRVDASTGIITVAAGSTSTTVCAATLDRYGDGCPASDGLANLGGGYTSLGKPYAIAVARNGDIYISAGISLVQKISASTGLMTVVAGVTSPAGKTGAYVSGYTGDLGPATSAELNLPRGIALSPSNDLYIADYTNNVVRVVYNGGAPAASQIIAANASVTAPVVGNIYTIAGSHSATAGTTGDNGPASAALLTNPSDVAVDLHGNVFIVDQSKEIRMIYAGGGVMGVASPVVNNIYRVAGGGTVKGNTLNVIAGTTATMSTVRRVTTDAHGNLFVSDQNEIIWFVDASTGWMRPIAGVYKGSTLPTGCPQQTDAIGNGCPATVAQIHLGTEGYGLAVDADENLYITDGSALTIRKVSPGLLFPSVTPSSPVTQTAELHFSNGAAPAVSGAFTFDNADFSAGTPSCNANGDQTSDCLVPVTLTPTVPGADISPLHTTDTLGDVGTLGYAGSGVVPALALDPGQATSFGQGESKPQRLASDGHGNLYIADTDNHRVLRYNIASQTQTVIAGTGIAGYTGDSSLAAAATLSSPEDVALAPDGTLYIADTGNNVIRRVDATTGVITTYAGGAANVCAAASDSVGDGCVPTQAIFSSPSGLVVTPSGLLYVADTGNARIRVVPLNQSAVQTVVGGAAAVCSAATDSDGDGCSPLQVQLSAPHGLRLDAAGDLLIADTGNNLVRRVRFNVPGQPVTAVAGNGQSGGSGDGAAATSAQLNAPGSIALDGAGNIYIADTGNHAIRFVSASTGTITTVAGFNGTSGDGTLPAIATALQLNSPAGIECAGENGLFIADSGNSRTISIDRTSAALSFGSTNISTSSVAQSITLTSTGSAAATLGTPLNTSTGSTDQLTLVSAPTNGCSAAETLGPGAACGLTAQFSPTAIGAETATYTFGGTSVGSGSAPSVTLNGVGKLLITTTTALAQTTPATGNPQYGQSIVFTATVTPSSQGPSSVTGTVTFSIDGVSQAPAALTLNGSGNGIATLTLPILTVGTHTLLVAYSGDDFYGTSSSAGYTLTVTRSQSAVALAASPTGIIQFQSVTFSAAVSAATGGIPTGTVTFTANGTTLGQGSLDRTGLATLTTSTLAVGSYNVVATYSGDTNFATSASTALTFVTSPDPPDFALSQSATALNVAQGGNVQTTFSLTPTNTLSGNVTFTCAGLPINSSCTFSPSVLTVSTGSLQAQSVTLTLWTNINPSAVSIKPAVIRIGGLVLLLPLGLLACARKRRFLTTALVAFVALAIVGAVSGCGQSQAVPPVVTPAGASKVTVTGTGPNGQVHTFTVTLTVTAAS